MYASGATSIRPFSIVFLEALCSHDLIQRVVERPQIRVNFTLQVARQETEFFTRLQSPDASG